MNNNDSAEMTVIGTFFQIRVNILDNKLIKIYNDKSVPILDFKPLCDKIGHYLKSEGFVTIKSPDIMIISP